MIISYFYRTVVIFFGKVEKFFYFSNSSFGVLSLNEEKKRE